MTNRSLAEWLELLEQRHPCEIDLGVERVAEVWQRYKTHQSVTGEVGRSKVITVAGTNGKGSTAHLIASGMKELGLRVGVFSSPHLFDFRERAKIGTEMVPKEFVCQFVASNHEYFTAGGFSFFELTTMLALSWFEHEAVDWIILETGMGGRLDATNICVPELTVITNIGLDHTQWLGTTLGAIAYNAHKL